MGEHAGCFLYINNIVCMSAESDGSFRPADLFEAPNRADVVEYLRRTSKCQASRKAAGHGRGEHPENDTMDSPHIYRFGAEAKPSEEVADDTPCLDDIPFNGLGVLSHGVLVDPKGGYFTDFTARDVLRPTLLRDQDSDQGSPKSPTETENEEHYRAGNFAAIRPRAVLTLWSSLEPILDEGSPFPNAMHNPLDVSDCLAWPRDGRLLSQGDVERLSRRQLQQQLATCMASAPKDTKTGGSKPGDNAAASPEFLQRWRDADRVRLASKARWPCETVLSPSLPARMQYHGATLDRGANAQAATTGDVGDEQTAVPGVSSFACYMGKPSMEYAKHKRGCRVTGAFASTGVETPLARLRLRPLNESAQMPTPKPQLGEASSASFLHPPDPVRNSARTRAWWVFAVYYHQLGVEPVTQRPSAQCEEPAAYRINEKVSFSAAACVKSKCAEAAAAAEQQREVRKRTRAGFPSNFWNPSQKDRSEVSDAWNYLLLHQRSALFARLERVERYLRKLNRLTNV